ncbi:MAG TPA: porin [Planctomycetota bacterium]|nr:porin [Planctomycetota bacterium]
MRLETLAGILSLFIAPLSAAAPASPPVAIDGDDENSVEAELLRTLRENGVINDEQFKKLSQLAAKLRADRASTNAELDASIKRLSESLVEKYGQAESAPAGSVTVKNTGDGFRFQSNDGKFELHPWFVLRERFTYVNQDSDTATGVNNDDTGSFETRTARLWFDGHILTKDLTYLIMIDVASSTAGVLRDAYLDYRFAPELHVRTGQQKRPVDREGFTYAPRTGFVDKAPVVAFFQQAPARDFEPGITVWGELGAKELEYRIGLFNGDGANNGPLPAAPGIGPGGGVLTPLNSSNNDSSGLETVARVQWSPLGEFGYTEGDYERVADPRFVVGGHLSYNPEKATANAAPPPALVQVETNFLTWGLDAAFKQEGFFALAEFFCRRNSREFPLPAPDTTDFGYLVQGQYFFGSETANRGFEIAARWSQIDVGTGTIGGIGVPAVGADTLVNDYSVGLNYLFNGHRLKIQGAYTHRDRSLRGTTPGFDEDIFQVQLQAIF